jgi:hypothetical protein
MFRIGHWHIKSHTVVDNSLVEDVLGDSGSNDKVPMEKVVMLIWQFRDDPSVVMFMARFMAKVCVILCAGWMCRDLVLRATQLTLSLSITFA